MFEKVPDVNRLNTFTEQWHQTAPMPYPKFRFSVVVADGCLYVEDGSCIEKFDPLSKEVNFNDFVWMHSIRNSLF